MIDLAQAADCDCLHPGYGFLSESADFAQATLDAGLLWIGPNVEAIKLMGDKNKARALAAGYQVPILNSFQILPRLR